MAPGKEYEEELVDNVTIRNVKVMLQGGNIDVSIKL